MQHVNLGQPDTLNSQVEFISVPELAKVLGLSRSQTFRRVQSGEIPAQKIGKNYLISKDYVAGLMGTVASTDASEIKQAVKKTINQYGSVLKQLGKE